MRKTKIVCTIGPACEDVQVLREMCLAGMDVARLNFSHGDHEDNLRKLRLVKQVRKELGMPVAIMLDTKGPEYRIGLFKEGMTRVHEGDTFVFTTEDILGDETRVSVSYKGLMGNLEKGDTILINNGLVSMKVLSVTEKEASCEVVHGGVLSNRKSMNFPGKVMTQEFLSEQDRADLLFGIEQDVDFVAASFVSNKEDVLSIRRFLDENGGEDIEIIAKIENRSGVNHIDEICEIANGVMVARGDLGVEIPGVEVPAVQKYLISKCRLLGKRVITATEMLESMISNSRPTRAEISDVANAVYDGTSAVMLSGETAAGKYPVEAVKTMAEAVTYTEQNIDYKQRFLESSFVIKNMQDAISHATCSMAIDVKAKCIVVNSISGQTARLVSRFRCPVAIIGMTTSQKGWRKLNLSWGVVPVWCDTYQSMEEMFENNLKYAKETLALEPGDHLVLTGGLVGRGAGNTNLIKVEQI